MSKGRTKAGRDDIRSTAQYRDRLLTGFRDADDDDHGKSVPGHAPRLMAAGARRRLTEPEGYLIRRTTYIP